MNGMTILCVEDQPECTAVLRSMLEGIGYEVMHATSGKQAIDVLSRRTIDGILLEHNLSDATSLTLRGELKALRPDVPVLLFSGVTRQTPFMLRFFDAYLRNPQQIGYGLEGLEP